jgi:hypothetical protein
MSRPGWWELAVVARKLGFRIDNLMRLVRRLRRDGLITSDESSSDGREIRHGRGDRRLLFYLSPSAVVVVASHARTPEAAEFRRRALSRLTEMPSNALPASHDMEEVAALRSALYVLEQRFAELHGKTGALSARVEQLEARVPEQLQLPMGTEVDHIALHAAFVAAFEKLQTAVNGPNPSRGLKSTEVFDLIQVGHVAALELREATKAINGGRMPMNAVVFGKLIQRVSTANGALEGRWGHNHVRRWLVVAKGVH